LKRLRLLQYVSLEFIGIHDHLLSVAIQIEVIWRKHKMKKIAVLGLIVAFFCCTVAFAEPLPAANGCRNYYQIMPGDMKNYLLTLISNAESSGFEQYQSGSYIVQAVKIDGHTVYMKFYEYGQTTMASCIELVQY